MHLLSLPPLLKPHCCYCCVNLFLVMGPGLANSLPTRPKFTWDAKSPPWTDGKGNQEKFKLAVEDWKEYHDSLPAANSHKLVVAMQGIVLKSQLFGQAADLCAEITKEQLKSANGVKLIVNAVYQRDALSVISEAYEGFNSLLTTRRSNTESLKSFELRFSAAVTKFNSLSTTTKLPQCITALMLLSNANVDQTSRVSVLAASAPSTDDFNDNSTNDDFLAAVTYKQLASVVKQCERASVNPAAYNETLTASSAGAMPRSRNGGYRGSAMRQPSNAALARLPCHVCKKFGHWKDSHRRDGSLAPNTKSYSTGGAFAAANIMSMPPDNGAGSSQQHRNRNTVSFNMATTSGADNSAGSTDSGAMIGPLVDDGAPYSAIGMAELKLLLEHSAGDGDIELDDIPEALDGHTHWQYGTGQHASARRPILGSVKIDARSDGGATVSIRHLVLDGSSQWVIGKNVTQHANILHMAENALQFECNGVMDKFTLMTHKFLSYIPLAAFVKAPVASSALTCLNGNATTHRPWAVLQNILDKVHRHVCGHANFTDMRLLLERNEMWSPAVQQYLTQVVDRCTSCRHTAPPEPSRKVSISSFSTAFNEVVAVDHFHLEGVRIFHCMDVATRYSIGNVCVSASLDDAAHDFHQSWLAQFWTPDAVLGDKAFAGGKFREMLDKIGVKFRLVPPRRHIKNPIESKHGIIRSIFLRLRHANPDESAEVSAVRAVTISNDLYGNDVMSSFEMAKGFTKPVDSRSVKAVPADILEAQDKLKARRKMALILKSKATKDVSFSVGDMVEVYSNTGMNKKGKWSTPKIVLLVDKQSGNITVPGKNGRRAIVAAEDARLALPDDSLASAVQRAIDEVDDVIDYAADAQAEAVSTAPPLTVLTHEDADFSGSNAESTRVVNDDAANVPDLNNDVLPADDEVLPNLQTDIHLGDRLRVYWPMDDKYYPGQINTIYNNGEVDVLYDDGDVERLNLDNEAWEFTGESYFMPASSAELMEVTDKEPEVLREMMNHFGNKAFLLHQAQGFEQFPLVTSYNREEESFVKTVKIVSRDEVPPQANVIGSHVLYKLKLNDDGSLKLKARIAPHGNEDDLKDLLASDCSTCPPTGLRIVESIASLMKWRLYKADVKSAFLQTGPARREVYVKPPRESAQRATHMWLLLTAAYGLVNANAKWQVKSDECFFELGMLQCQQIPQLFYKHEGGKLVLLAAKVVDDIKVAGEGDRAEDFIKRFNQKFELGTVARGPGKMRFFGINTVQHDDKTVSTDADDKLNSLVEADISRTRRKEYDAPINEIERAAYASTNSSLGWIGTAASPFCSFHSSYLQQKAPNTKVSHMVEQQVLLRKLKKLGTVISYPRPTDATEYDLTVLVFSDASRTDDRGQLGILCGLLVGELKSGAIFHTASWSSFVSKRPVKNVPAAEIFAAGHGIDMGKAVAHAYSQILNMIIPVRLCVDSKDLFTSLSTQRNSIDRSIRGDVASIRYEFQVGNVRQISWIPGKINLADVLTKKDSPLTDALQLTLFNGRLNLDFEGNHETKSSDKNYG